MGMHSLAVYHPDERRVDIAAYILNIYFYVFLKLRQVM